MTPRADRLPPDAGPILGCPEGLLCVVLGRRSHQFLAPSGCLPRGRSTCGAAEQSLRARHGVRKPKSARSVPTVGSGGLGQKARDPSTGPPFLKKMSEGNLNLATTGTPQLQFLSQLIGLGKPSTCYKGETPTITADLNGALEETPPVRWPSFSQRGT